jgi:hypothetical protein
MNDAVKWLVLDNLKSGWLYWMNICGRDKADDAYKWCVESGLIRDGNITASGIVWLITAYHKDNP